MAERRAMNLFIRPTFCFHREDIFDFVTIADGNLDDPTPPAFEEGGPLLMANGEGNLSGLNLFERSNDEFVGFEETTLPDESVSGSVAALQGLDDFLF